MVVEVVTTRSDDPFSRLHAAGWTVSNEIGEIIVAEVNQARIEELIAPDGAALKKLIRKEV